MNQPTTLLQDVCAEAARRVHADHSTLPQLLQLLAYSGDLDPMWHASAWLEPGSLEHGCADIFHAGGITRVYFDGTIEQFPN
jgi:hypothetical protein